MMELAKMRTHRIKLHMDEETGSQQNINYSHVSVEQTESTEEYQ